MGNNKKELVLSAKEDWKKQKEMTKALETPEEKKAHQLAKKAVKKKKTEREKMGWSEEYMGYTNEENLYGDKNLQGTFKWQK
ncbi:cactin-like, partial [Tachysurus ichikawai]